MSAVAEEAAERHGLAVRLAAMGPAGIRIAQMLALRWDLFDPSCIAALQEVQEEAHQAAADARRRFEREVGRPLDAVLPALVAFPTLGNPLQYAVRGPVSGRREILLRVARPEAAPSPAQLDRALRAAALALPPHVERQWAIRSMRADLIHWIAAELDLSATRRRIGRMRERALGRTGILLPRPIRALCAPHVLALELITGVPVLEVAAWAAAGDEAALERHGIDAGACARAVIEAALEQVTEFGSVPIEPRLDLLVVLPGNRLAWIDVPPEEPLAPSLTQNLHRYVRAFLSGDAELIAAVIDELVDRMPEADPGRFHERVADACRAWRNRGTGRPRVPAFLSRVLSAARATGHRIPADVLALARWSAAAAEAAARIDPGIRIGEAATGFVARRRIEALFELPRSDETARGLLAVIDLADRLPDRLDRLLANAASDHFRLRVEEHRSADDRSLRRDQLRLVCAALFWLGLSVLILAVPAAPVEGAAVKLLSLALWTAAAGAAVAFLLLWRRLP